RVPAPAVRRDEDERRRAGRHQERRRRRHGGLLAFDAATVYTRRMRPLLLVVAALLLVANAGAERPHVYLVVVDGPDAPFATAPELVTAGVFGKLKLARLFSAVPGRQRAPDILWSPEQASPAGRDPVTGYSFDTATIGGLLAEAGDEEPDLAVVNLSDVDRAAHGRGPDSEECIRAIAGADAAIGRLVDQLRALGRWSHSVLIVTADHGFTSLAATPERPYPVISFGRDLLRVGVGAVHLVGDGGIEHVYADGLAADATDLGDT